MPDIPDVAFVNLRFPSGVIANIDIAWLSPVKLRRTVIVGSQRMALYDDTESVEKVKVFDHGVDYKDPETFGEFHLSYRTGDIVAPKLDTVEPLFAEASHFIECVTTGKRPITDGVAGLRVVASLEAAERSLRNHGGVQPIEPCRTLVWCRERPGARRRTAWRSHGDPVVSRRRRRTLGHGRRTCSRRCILGKPPRGAGEGELPLAIGAGAVIRPFTTIYAGSTIGDRLQTGQGASIREDNVLGDDVSIGTNAVLEFGNRLGSRVRIHSGCFLELVTIEDDVFVGPNVVFTDDPHPMGCPRYQDCKGGAVVRRLARIGANSTILPGVEIGEGSLVGAGSVVVHDVPPGAVVAGNPARVIKQVAELTCPPGWFEHPYTWPPYAELQSFDPGEACEEVIDHLHVPQRYEPPAPRD